MSDFLLDTNIPSETVKLRPEPRVTQWIIQQPNSKLYLSAVSIGELRRGFVTMPHGQRRARLEHWLDNDVALWFDQRILPLRERLPTVGACLMEPASYEEPRPALPTE